MAHSFLPVNPCCTDVVLNTPCGCSSTLPNNACNNNPCGTNITLSSNVIYNGPELPCIIAEPCNTLNVVLQKIDEIICNLLSQINILNTQIDNITTQIITINGDIININNSLDECCNTTTTTTTTASLCNQYTIIGLSGGGFFTYTNCSGGFQEGAVGSGNIVTFCAISIDTEDNVYIINDGPCVL